MDRLENIMSGNIEAHDYNDYREPGEYQNIGGMDRAKTHLQGYCRGFLQDIDRMNAMYRMPAVEVSIAAFSKRLDEFHSILQEECDEIGDIQEYVDGEPAQPDVSSESFQFVKAKTMLADLLGDIIVYCASEAKRWDIPIDRVLNTIMQSNFSKLGPDGQPIYDERMKLLKGPNYWKPEPEIEKVLIDWISRSTV